MAYEQLGFTAGQLVTAQQLSHMDNGIKKAQNVKNLLDNSDFTNPVNQRGNTSITTNWAYIIDRWLSPAVSSATPISISADGVTLHNATGTSTMSLRQHIANVPNGTYTAAALINGLISLRVFTLTDGTIAYGAYVNHSGSQIYIDFSNSTLRVHLQAFAGNAITCEWAALYKGEYTVETLPDYVPKGYGTELYECKRYFQKVTSQGKFFGDTAGYAGYVYVPYEQEMRAIPTLSVTANGSLIGEQAQGLTISSTPVAVNSSTTGMTVQVPSSVESYVLCVWSEPSFTLNADL